MWFRIHALWYVVVIESVAGAGLGTYSQEPSHFVACQFEGSEFTFRRPRWTKELTWGRCRANAGLVRKVCWVNFLRICPSLWIQQDAGLCRALAAQAHVDSMLGQMLGQMLGECWANFFRCIRPMLWI